MSRTSRKRSNQLAQVGRSLAEVPLGNVRPELRDLVSELTETLDQITRVRSGEIRVLALGHASSMKSTTLRLLLGTSEVLNVGAGAISAAATEIRLVPTAGTPAAPRTRVHTLTEKAARRRARALLKIVEPDDPRSLSQLAQVDHENRAIVARMVEDSNLLGFGRGYDLAEFTALGGTASFGDGARGATMIARIVVELSIPTTTWNLSWAKDRGVVVVDTPGTRQGGPLEQVVLEEMRGRTHIALLTVAVSPGASMKAPAGAPGFHRVLIATKIDAVEDPANLNQRITLEGEVDANLRMLRNEEQESSIVVISGPWAMGSEADWTAFDSASPGVWARAARSKEEWRHALESSTEDGPLYEAVRDALADGGVGRLRREIARLAGNDPERVDEEELTRLLELAQERVTEALGLLPAPHQEAQLRKLRAEARKSAVPIAELRDIAAETAIEVLYGSAVWRSVRMEFDNLQRFWLAPTTKIYDLLAGLDFPEIATNAVTTAQDDVTESLVEWQEDYYSRLAVTEIPVSIDLRIDEEEVTRLAKQYDKLARMLVEQLKMRRNAAEKRDQLYFRTVARARDELAKLLERMITALFEKPVLRVRDEVVEGMGSLPSEVSQSALGRRLQDVQNALSEFSRSRAGSGL